MPANGAYMWQCPKLNAVTAKAVGPEAASGPSPRASQTVLWTWPISVLCFCSEGGCCATFRVLGSRETLSNLRKEQRPAKSTPRCHFYLWGALCILPALFLLCRQNDLWMKYQNNGQNGFPILTHSSSINSSAHWQEEFWPPGSESCLTFFKIKLFSLRLSWTHIQLWEIIQRSCVPFYPSFSPPMVTPHRVSMSGYWQQSTHLVQISSVLLVLFCACVYVCVLSSVQLYHIHSFTYPPPRSKNWTVPSSQATPT